MARVWLYVVFKQKTNKLEHFYFQERSSNFSANRATIFCLVIINGS